jgi:outer membrane protein, multidrug efflux system
MRKFILCMLVLLSLWGCMVGPDYKRPSIDTPQSWRVNDKNAKDLVNTAWWEQFDDPVLNELISTSLSGNKDLKIAAARVEEFVGQYIYARAPIFPQISAGTSVGRSRATARGPIPLPGNVTNPAYQYEASLGASWEIDFWGKIRRATEAARADLLRTEEARNVVILSLVTSVAGAYVHLRDLDSQLEIANSTARTREEYYKIFTLRFNAGYVSDLELSQVKSQYELALVTIPFIEKSITEQENALSVLLGRNPGPIPRGKTIDKLKMPAVPAGLPSDLLDRRPDIRLAEQELIGANARIGVAKAQYFPSISLTGAFGWSSTQLSNLFSGPARTWNWAAPLTAPIFTGGALTGQVISAEAVQQQALFLYQQSVQSAFRDVEDALIDQKRSREQLDAQGRQVEALRTYARVARLRYDNGYTSYIDVLDADRSLFDAELSYTETKGTLFQALVNVYKAMGGGWVCEADKMTATGKE